MLNRAAIIVRPDKPFMDWAAVLDDSGHVPNPDDEQTVYLVRDTWMTKRLRVSSGKPFP